MGPGGSPFEGVISRGQGVEWTDGGPSPSLNLISRSKLKSKIQEWVNVVLAHPIELSVWAFGVSPVFVTRLEQGPGLELP